MRGGSARARWGAARTRCGAARAERALVVVPGLPVTDPPLPEDMPPRAVWGIVVKLMLGTFLSTLDVLIVITALPTIIGDIGGRAELPWVVSAYLLTATASGPLYGKLGDLFGRRHLYMIAVAIFVGGSVVCATAGDVVQLIVGRTIQGIGAGGLMTLPLAIVAEVASPRDRPKYQSVLALNLTLASVVGPLIGGVLVDDASWRWIFLINIPLGGIALVAAARMKLPRHIRMSTKVDFCGALLVTALAGALVLFVSWVGSTYSWRSPEIAVLIGVAVLLLVALIIRERSTASPFLSLEFFASRYYTALIASSFLLSIAMYAAWVLLPLFLQIVSGASAANSGVLLLPFIIANSAAALVSGRLVARLGRAKGTLLSGIGIAAAGYLLYGTMGVGTPRLLVSAWMAVTGIGVGLAMQNYVVMLQATVSESDLGAATAILTFFRNLGYSFGAAVGLSIYDTEAARNLSRLPGSVRRAVSVGASQGGPAAIRALPTEVRREVVGAFSRSLHLAFAWTAPTAVVALLAVLFITNVRLTGGSRPGRRPPRRSRLPAAQADPIEGA
jgi:EmrB/QacA subfamily drug resistance transporter